MYGSRFSGGNLNHSLTHQFALIYRSLITMQEDGEDVDPHLVVHVPPVQQQNGMNDCGVYAIAFAMHAALGDTLKHRIRPAQNESPPAAMLQKERTCSVSNCEEVRWQI